MQPHEERVVQEKEELHTRIERLQGFINQPHDIFAALPVEEQVRLRKQHNIMREYEAVLDERIANFPAPSAAAAEEPAADAQ